jgi:CRP-like cAMP-binding protein
MVNPSLFQRFVPLQSLSHADRHQLARQSSVQQYKPGEVVFSQGEVARTLAFLLEGAVEVKNEQGVQLLQAGDEESRHALARGARRSASVVCIRNAQVLFVDAEVLDLLMTWSQTGRIEVRALEDDEADDWMTALLQSKAFLKVPPANIAQIFASMEPVSAEPGELIIRQGDAGDYYYVVSAGKVQVVVRTAKGTEEELAQLGVGRSFGEEALVSGNPRNASVRALTRCELMRLSAERFNKLMKAPVLTEVSLADRTPKVLLLDVRLPEEYQHGHVLGAVNLPLRFLRSNLSKLSPRIEYWVYCDTGRRSASATYLLCEQGFNAKLVKGGVPAAELQIKN